MILNFEHFVKNYNLTSESKILIVNAHPDDETIYSGLIQKLNYISAQIKIVTLSKGGAGRSKLSLYNKTIEYVRTLELMEVCKLLKINDIDLSDFLDSKFHVSYDKILIYLENQINSFRPDFVFTFEPYGITGHPDHIVLSEIVSKLYYKNHNFRLIYSTVSKKFIQPEISKRMAIIDESNIKRYKSNFIVSMTFYEALVKLRSILLHRTQYKLDINLIKMLYKMKCNFVEHYFIVDSM